MCDEDIQVVLAQNESEARINLNVYKEDKILERLVEQIIYSIAMDTTTESIKSELDPFRDIKRCERSESETPEHFYTHFNGCVACNANQTAEISDMAGQNWDIILLSNSKLTVDMMILVMLHILTTEGMDCET